MRGREDRGRESVTTSEPFAATVNKVGAKPTLVMMSDPFFRHQIGKFKDGERVTLIITNRRPKRSAQQNRYYWGAYLPMIAKETGEADLERLHELFKGKFLTTGVVEVLGHKVRMKKSTTALSVSEFSEYIEKIASETGIQPPPVEDWV